MQHTTIVSRRTIELNDHPIYSPTYNTTTTIGSTFFGHAILYVLFSDIHTIYNVLVMQQNIKIRCTAKISLQDLLNIAAPWTEILKTCLGLNQAYTELYLGRHIIVNIQHIDNILSLYLACNNDEATVYMKENIDFILYL